MTWLKKLGDNRLMGILSWIRSQTTGNQLVFVTSKFTGIVSPKNARELNLRANFIELKARLLDIRPKI
jgi:hypothetical protein